jgi:hypothetical protein
MLSENLENHLSPLLTGSISGLSAPVPENAKVFR